MTSGQKPRWGWFIEWMTPYYGTIKAVGRVYYQGRSKYQDIVVADIEGQGKTLILDGKTQSSQLDEAVYHEALVHPAMVLHGSPRRVLILGGGEGATAREVLRFNTVERVVMVDIDEEVVRVSREYLGEWHRGAFDDTRLELVIGDAWDYVASGGESFDVIIADLVDPQEGGPATRLYTREFYSMVRERLSEGGVFATQATSVSHTIEVHAVIFNTIKSVFRHAASYAAYVPSFDSLWGFVVASDSRDPAALGDGEVEERLRRLVKGSNVFYDGETHRHMFSIPRIYRARMSDIKDVATIERQVYMPA